MDVNVNSITGTPVFHRSVFSLAKKLNLLPNVVWSEANYYYA